MTKEPLGLPKGSIRAIIAVLIVVSVIVAIFIGESESVKSLTPIAGMVIGYYFAQRSNNKTGD